MHSELSEGGIKYEFQGWSSLCLWPSFPYLSKTFLPLLSILMEREKRDSCSIQQHLLRSVGCTSWKPLGSFCCWQHDPCKWLPSECSHLRATLASSMPSLCCCIKGGTILALPLCGCHSDIWVEPWVTVYELWTLLEGRWGFTEKYVSSYFQWPGWNYASEYTFRG